MPPRGPEFTTEEVERSLTALALCSGNAARARDMLQHDETLTRVPSERVLQLWRNGKHAERFQELLKQRAPEIEAATVQDYLAIAKRTNEIHLEGLEQVAAGMPDLDAKDAAQALRNISVAGGVAADKYLVYNDRPNVITSHASPDETLRALATRFGIDVHESTAEDITNQPQLTD
jgi:hypothetical protein